MPPPTGCAVKVVVDPEAGVVAVTAVGGVTPGQVTVEVNSGNAAPTGVAVCVQLSVAFTAAACGTQLKPIAGAFAPKAAGPATLRFAPAVIVNADAPVGGMVQANAKLPPAVPAVTTVTAAVPVPPVNVTVAGSGLAVGATDATVAAGQVKPQTRDTGAPAFSVQVNVAVPAVAARVQPKLMEPAVVT